MKTLPIVFKTAVSAVFDGGPGDGLEITATIFPVVAWFNPTETDTEKQFAASDDHEAPPLPPPWIRYERQDAVPVIEGVSEVAVVLPIRYKATP